MKRLLRGLPFAALWLLLLAPATEASSVCRDNPLAIYGTDASRYQMIDSCTTVTGEVLLWAEEAPELGGEKHVWLGIGNGWIEAEFADVALIPPLSQLAGLRRVTVMGARVYDTTQGREAIRPAWGLDVITRAYPERRPDRSVWRVWQWQDGHYSEEFIK